MYFRLVVLVLTAFASSSTLVHAQSVPKSLTIVGHSHVQRRFAEPKSPLLTTFRGGVKGPLTFVPSSQKASVVLGLILALNSGFINGCCLSGAIAADGTKQAVAAVTASWTNSALGMASGDMSQFSFLAKIIVAFIGGSAIAGFLNPSPAQFQAVSSAYAKPLGVGAIMLVVAAKLLNSAESVKTGMLLCAMANGIQNSVTSTLTGNLCRTSHFTGISSDMGTFMGQILAGNKANEYKLQVFLGLAASFFLGSYVAYSIGKEFGSMSLLFSAGLYGLIIVLYESLARKLT